jgi:NAD(P)-dependent dehydrogenase (short-subunit alcohol dehydrogenase family)
MIFEFSPAEQAFAEEVRGFLRAHPPEIFAVDGMGAGYAGVGGRIGKSFVEGFDETMGVLVRDGFLGIKKAARVMKKQGPGSIISTTSVAGLSPDRADEVIPFMKGVFENVQPIKRPGLPDDIARAAVWLASDESGSVNGHALVVDEGLIGGRLWSEVQQRREMFRATLGLT